MASVRAKKKKTAAAEAPVKATAVKAAAKAETVKNETVKTETVKEDIVKETPAAAPVEKAPAAEKVAEKKAEKAVEEKAAKKPAAKRTTRKKAVEAEVYVQFMGKEVSEKDILTAVKANWMSATGSKETDIKDLKVYVKLEENRAYYVVNGEAEGSYIEL